MPSSFVLPVSLDHQRVLYGWTEPDACLEIRDLHRNRVIERIEVPLQLALHSSGYCSVLHRAKTNDIFLFDTFGVLWRYNLTRKKWHDCLFHNRQIWINYIRTYRFGKLLLIKDKVFLIGAERSKDQSISTWCISVYEADEQQRRYQKKVTTTECEYNPYHRYDAVSSLDGSKIYVMDTTSTKCYVILLEWNDSKPAPQVLCPKWNIENICCWNGMISLDDGSLISLGYISHTSSNNTFLYYFDRKQWHKSTICLEDVCGEQYTDGWSEYYGILLQKDAEREDKIVNGYVREAQQEANFQPLPIYFIQLISSWYSTEQILLFDKENPDQKIWIVDVDKIFVTSK